MIYVERFCNALFNSNTFCIHLLLGHSGVWLIDVVCPSIVNRLAQNGFSIHGVLITHAHYDHIIGLRKLVELFPQTKIYASEFCALGLCSSKLNLSYYHGDPIELEPTLSLTQVSAGSLQIFPGIDMDIIETPGHNHGCLSFSLQDFLFTGDSYIPFHKVVTKLPGGDKQQSIKSILKLKHQCNENSIICPGHGEMIKYSESDLFLD